MQRAAHPSGCARCGAAADSSAIKYQSLTERWLVGWQLARAEQIRDAARLAITSQIVVFNHFEYYHISPDCGERQYKSRT